MKSRTLTYYRDLIGVLVAKEFKVRYKSTVLGYLWSILHPLAFAMVYFLVFKKFMDIPTEDYALFLITGLFPWQWFQNSLNASNASFVGNASLIKKVNFSRAFLVLAGVLNDVIHFLISIPVIVGFMLYYHETPSVNWLWGIPLLVAIQLLLTYGVALFLATCNLFFRDLERLTIILTTLWFFATPIIYPVEMIPDGYRWLLYANPMAGLTVCWRSLFREGFIPMNLCGSAFALAVVAYLLGAGVYRALKWRFAEVV